MTLYLACLWLFGRVVRAVERCSAGGDGCLLVQYCTVHPLRCHGIPGPTHLPHTQTVRVLCCIGPYTPLLTLPSTPSPVQSQVQYSTVQYGCPANRPPPPPQRLAHRPRSPLDPIDPPHPPIPPPSPGRRPRISQPKHGFKVHVRPDRSALHARLGGVLILDGPAAVTVGWAFPFSRPVLSCLVLSGPVPVSSRG